MSLYVTICKRASLFKALTALPISRNCMILCCFNTHKQVSDEWKSNYNNNIGNMPHIKRSRQVLRKAIRSKRKKRLKRWKVTKYSRQEEISNVLIKYTRLVREGSRKIFFPLISDEMRKCKKSIFRRHQGKVHNWHFIFDKTNVRGGSEKVPKVLCERNFGAAHHLRLLLKKKTRE